MTASTKKDVVLSRVRKMLALANDAAVSEGERDNALRMAHATLAKYNLSLSEAETAGADADESRVSDSAAETIGHAWLRTIFYAVAQLYFCKYYTARLNGQKVRHYFIGRESNTTTARRCRSSCVVRCKPRPLVANAK